MTAALALADQGFETFLVEREAELGGFFRKIHYTLEGRDPRSYLEGLVDRVDSNELIHIFKGARLEDISGYVGNFSSTIALGSGEEPMEMEHGVVIVATGGEEYTPSEYLYGTDPRVKTQHELEELLTEGASRQNLNNVVMIQCVGSRDEERPYCSRMCCGEAVKNALKVKELDPNTNVYVLYRDVRTYGLMEEHYTRAREAGIVFIRYDEERKPQVERLDGGNALGILRVSVLDPVLQEEVEIDADLLVLSTAVVAPRDNGSLAKMLKVPVNEDGFFLEAHAKLRPVDFATEGVFVCGVAHSPMPYREALAQARAAASRAITILSKEQIEAQGVVASVNKGRCSGCGLCVEVCAYNAIEVDEKERVAVVNSAMCKGCGACSAQCRSSAIDVLGFTDGQIYAVIKSITR
jgi:heterodisulfide reductase subunit A